MWGEFCNHYSLNTEEKISNISIEQQVKNIKKEDKYRIVKIIRVNPNGKYGNYTIEKAITKNQLEEIEKILGVSLDDYRFN